MSCHASDHPLINDADLLVKLVTVLVPIPASGLPFIMHLLDDSLLEITLEVSSINAHKLALAGKIGLVATLLYFALPGDRVNLPIGELSKAI